MCLDLGFAQVEAFFPEDTADFLQSLFNVLLPLGTTLNIFKTLEAFSRRLDVPLFLITSPNIA